MRMKVLFYRKGDDDDYCLAAVVLPWLFLSFYSTIRVGAWTATKGVEEALQIPKKYRSVTYLGGLLETERIRIWGSRKG